MSSWISDLLPDRTYAAVVGHGMIAEELAANPRLDRFLVQDRSSDATLPLEDRSLEGASTVSLLDTASSLSPYSLKCGGCWCGKPPSSPASQAGVLRQIQSPSGDLCT
jgi:hypothetical protein